MDAGVQKVAQSSPASAVTGSEGAGALVARETAGAGGADGARAGRAAGAGLGARGTIGAGAGARAVLLLPAPGSAGGLGPFPKTPASNCASRARTSSS